MVVHELRHSDGSFGTQPVRHGHIACAKHLGSRVLAASGGHAVPLGLSVSVNGVDEWVSDALGRLEIPGLRLSGFANGLDRDTVDPLFRHYWVAPTCAPEGWSWVSDRLRPGAVFSTVNAETIIFEVLRRSESLPVTGTQIAGAGILGAMLVVGGASLLAARNRSDEHHRSVA